MSDSVDNMIISLLNRIESKVDQNTEDVSELKVIIARLTETVITHEKRSTSLEELVSHCRSQCEARLESTENLAEVSINTISTIKTFFKWLGIIVGGFISLIGAVIAIVEFLSKK